MTKMKTKPAEYTKRRTSPRGKAKTLAACGPNSGKEGRQKPLGGKTLYLDLKGYRGATKVEADLKLLGAKIESSFTKEVHILITNRGTLKDYEKAKKDGSKSEASPGISNPSPFNPGWTRALDSPQESPGQEDCAKPISRAQAMVTKARITQNYGSTNIIEWAKQWKIRIVHIDKVQSWVGKELEKLPGSVKDHAKLESRKTSKQTTVRRLKGSYVKFEATNLHYRPVQQQLDKAPKVMFDTPAFSCPFELKEQGTDNETKELKAECDARGQLDSKKESLGHVTKQGKELSTEETCKKMTAGELRQFIRDKLDYRKKEAKKGYCEICQVKYDNINTHLKCDTHKKFVKDNKNYASLDAMISGGPNLDQFLEDVVRYHELHMQEGIQMMEKEEKKSKQKLAAKKAQFHRKDKKVAFQSKGKAKPVPVVLETRKEVVPVKQASEIVKAIVKPPSKQPSVITISDELTIKSSQSKKKASKNIGDCDLTRTAPVLETDLPEQVLELTKESVTVAENMKQNEKHVESAPNLVKSDEQNLAKVKEMEIPDISANTDAKVDNSNLTSPDCTVQKEVTTLVASGVRVVSALQESVDTKECKKLEKMEEKDEKAQNISTPKQTVVQKTKCMTDEKRSTRLIKLKTNWSMLSDRSMQKLLMSSEGECEKFTGFQHPISSLSQDPPTDLSFVSVDEVELPEHSENEWILDEPISGKETEEKYLQYNVPMKNEKLPRSSNNEEILVTGAKELIANKDKIGEHVKVTEEVTAVSSPVGHFQCPNFELVTSTPNPDLKKENTLRERNNKQEIKASKSAENLSPIRKGLKRISPEKVRTSPRTASINAREKIQELSPRKRPNLSKSAKRKLPCAVRPVHQATVAPHILSLQQVKMLSSKDSSEESSVSSRLSNKFMKTDRQSKDRTYRLNYLPVCQHEQKKNKARKKQDLELKKNVHSPMQSLSNNGSSCMSPVLKRKVSPKKRLHRSTESSDSPQKRPKCTNVRRSPRKSFLPQAKGKTGKSKKNSANISYEFVGSSEVDIL